MPDKESKQRLVPVRPGQKHDVVKQPGGASIRDAAASWVEEHPADKPFDPTAGTHPDGATPPTPSGAATELTGKPAPSGEPPAPTTETSGAKPPSAAAPPASGPPQSGLPELPGKPKEGAAEDAPGARGEPPAAAAPVATGPIPFDRTKSYTLADGAPAWTGDQIVDGLREREQFASEIAKTKPVFELFQTDPETTLANWKPVVEKIKDDPAAAWLANQALFGDPGLQRYLHTCAAHYASLSPEDRAEYDQIPPQTGASKPEQTATASLPKEVQDRLDRFDKYVNAQMERDFKSQQERELGEVVGKYPFLRDNRPVVLEILKMAKMLNASDPTKGVAAAAQEMGSLLELLRIKSDREAAAAAEIPPPEVPALNGGGGANPSGTRRTHHPGPKVYKDTREALKAHMEEYPE